MDFKSIVLNKRMKFFLNITLISSCPFLNWAYLYGVQDTPEPSHRLFFPYSKLHNLQPKSDDPNIACAVPEIPLVDDGMSDPLISLPRCLCSTTEDIQHAYEHGPCSQLPLEYEHFQNRISVSTNHDSDAGYLLEEPGIDILSPIQDDSSNYLSNVNFFGTLTFYKTKTFIETKVTAMKLQGFNL
jgi:hypothetical protein